VNPAYPPVLDELHRGPPTKLTDVGGGCIAQARVATFADGSGVFVKTAAFHPAAFEREAEGLRQLASAGALRVPAVLAVCADALVLELVHSGRKPPNFFEEFGRAFSELHRHHGQACGFPQDNFIGSNPQPNHPVGADWIDASDPTGQCWPDFFIERRLRFQLQLAESNGHGDELTRLLDRAEQRIRELLSCAIEPPSLLHGDLWGGNYLVDEQGRACLIDPAVYYGHREADLAMTRLFGGFGESFYAAYEQYFPLAEGHLERLRVYQLYHLLNHLNLFGRSYYGQSQQILRYYAS
jgi:fructosamine-3-kinase